MADLNPAVAPRPPATVPVHLQALAVELAQPGTGGGEPAITVHRLDLTVSVPPEPGGPAAALTRLHLTVAQAALDAVAPLAAEIVAGVLNQRLDDWARKIPGLLRPLVRPLLEGLAGGPGTLELLFAAGEVRVTYRTAGFSIRLAVALEALPDGRLGVRLAEIGGPLSALRGFVVGKLRDAPLPAGVAWVGKEAVAVDLAALAKARQGPLAVAARVTVVAVEPGSFAIELAPVPQNGS